MTGNSVRPTRPLTYAVIVSALVAIFALSSVAPELAAAEPGAVQAAKKCKKIKNKQKRKRCRQKARQQQPVSPPGAGSSPAPAPPLYSTHIARVSLHWGCDVTPIEANASVDLDLHVWDAGGAHSGWNEDAQALDEQIPGGDHLGDDTGTWAAELCGSEGYPATAPSEVFEDTRGDSHLVTVGVCYWNSSYAPAPSVDWDLHFEYTNGSEAFWNADTEGYRFTAEGDNTYLVAGEGVPYRPTQVCFGS